MTTDLCVSRVLMTTDLGVSGVMAVERVVKTCLAYFNPAFCMSLTPPFACL